MLTHPQPIYLSASELLCRQCVALSPAIAVHVLCVNCAARKHTDDEHANRFVGCLPVTTGYYRFETASMADTGRGGINSTSTLTVDSKEWLVLQPLWDVVLANSYYTSSPLFFVLIADGFFFVCIIPYMILDFYGLDHWGWVKRYKIYPDVRVTWSQAWTCFSNTLWNQLLFVLPITMTQWVWSPSAELPTRAPPFFEFLWHQVAALIIFDALYYVWHVIHHRVPILYRYLHSVHHRYTIVNVSVAQYDHPWELISLGVLGTISPMCVGAHPLTSWAFMMLHDWIGADSHGGYDLPGLPHRWVPFWGGPVQHAMHHQRPLTNFQPYFAWFDRLFGTECPGVQASGYRSPQLIEWERRNGKKHKLLN